MFAFFCNFILIVALLWTAPELLRLGSRCPLEGTVKGDVYSFAIILTEMYSRAGPYHMNDESVEGMHLAIVTHVQFQSSGSAVSVHDDWIPEVKACLLTSYRTLWTMPIKT